MDAPALFRLCRETLRLSADELAAELQVSGGRTVRKWEAGDRAIPGPVWVALRYMVAEIREPLLAREITTLLAREREAA